MTCPSCGKELPGEFPFCPFCGSALAGRPSADREERKIVTVLFADLVGFTSRAERLDPEDVRTLLSRYHAHLRTELERFGGTVEKFIGDAVMAVFGAPASHEDDPERAVRAGLAIRDWAVEQGEELQVRIAVNTGEALVALAARPGEGEAMVAGDVVNTAARLQAGAPLNGVLVAESTHGATAEVFEYRAVEAIVAKGKSAPLRAWEAVAARSRFGVDLTRRPTTPLVGRERELDLVVSALARVREERSPQLVTLVGVPGIGKTRLVFELSRAVEEAPELISWRQGRSLPYGDGVTFWALTEIVKAQAGILESDPPDLTEEKLRHAVRQVAVDAAEAQWLERHLRPLAGLADESSAAAGEVFAAWRRFLEALAVERPIVLVFEDLHWADEAMLEFVDELVERVEDVPLLVLGTARPELLQRRPGWGGGKPNALTISLSPLSEEETARMLQGLLERPLLDARQQEALLARAGGNPLYAEQYARVLAERGEVAELPETLQGIVAARLDALPEPEKLLLQDAAVVGKVFWLGAVEAVGGVARLEAEELLHALSRKEFVQRSRTSSVAGESEYAFRHLLIRDVAYSQIPRAGRSAKHAAAAAWIESLGRPEEQAELLAHHYLQALELAEAAGLDTAALAGRAREALRDAGERAAALYALEAAERFFDAALRLWPSNDPERAHVLLRRAAPVHDLGGSKPEQLVEARDALLATGNLAEAAEAEMLLSQAYWIRGDPDRATEHADRASALIADAPPSPSTAWVTLRLASRAAIGHGAHAASLELATRALAICTELDWPEGVSEALSLVASNRIELGDRGGLEDFERSIEIAETAGALSELSRIYNNFSTMCGILGNLDRGYELRTEGARLAERIGSARQTRWFLGVLSEYPYRRGDWDEALRLTDEFLAPVEAGDPHYISWQVLARRAEIRLARGQIEAACSDAERALDLIGAITDPQARYFTNALCAHVFSASSRNELASRLLGEIRDDLVRGVGMSFAAIGLPAAASAALGLGLLQELSDALAHQLRTPWVEAVRCYAAGELVGAAEILAGTGSRPEEARARLHAAGQLAAAGRRTEAEEQVRQALAFYRSVQAMLYVREGEALLAA